MSERFNLFHNFSPLLVFTAQFTLDHLALLQPLHSLPEDIDDVPQDDTHWNHIDSDITAGSVAYNFPHISCPEYATEM